MTVACKHPGVHQRHPEECVDDLDVAVEWVCLRCFPEFDAQAGSSLRTGEGGDVREGQRGHQWARNTPRPSVVEVDAPEVPPPTLIRVPIQGRDSDERYTPKWIFDGLGLEFDLDPASPVGGGDCVPARVKYTRNDDGLARDWFGSVWLNPPFSQATAWADRFREHGNGVFLGPVANAAWWFRLVRSAWLVWHCRDFAFTHPTHAGRRSSMPLAMMAIGLVPTSAVLGLARSGVHDGVLMEPRP